MGFVEDLLGLGNNGASFQAGGVNQGNLQGAMQRVSGSGGTLDQQQQFLNALGQQGGIGNQSSVFGQQQNLANMLGQQAMGGGPNPALAQLANTTGQNINSQAALMAGQRGIGANPGLAARNIGQMGAQQNQMAGGQAAALGAQQQLNAQQQLQNQQAMMGNLATQQVGQQSGALGQLGNMAQSYQNQVGGQLANQNQTNAGMAQANSKRGGDVLGGLIGGVGSVLTGGLLNQGGEVEAKVGPASRVGQHIAQMNQGGKVPVKLSPGEKVVDPKTGSARKVPGKAKVSGDSPENDTVGTSLKPGSIVVPRTKVKDPEKAKAFVEEILRKKGKL